MIYLASPYTHTDPAIELSRYEQVCQQVARLMREGVHVFSPIAHSHGCTKYGLPGDWDFWQAIDVEWISMCSELWVLRIDGWAMSRGIAAEIDIANNLGKRVRYIDPVEEE